MPPLTRLTLSLLAATATILTVYSYFSGESTDDDEPGSSSPSSSDPATDASYPAQQTSARVGQTTVRTPTVADHDSGMRRPGLTSSDFTESHVLHPASPYTPSSHSYQRAPSPDDTHVHVSRLTVSPKEHSRTQSFSSDSDYLGPSSHTWAAPRSRSPLPDVVSDPGADDVVSKAEGNKKARELREKARRSTREMLDARDRAKSARRRGDRVAESEHKQEARAHESEMKDLNKKAAKIIFRLKNQVRGKPCVEVPIVILTLRVVGARVERKEWSTSTGCMLRKLSSTQNGNSNPLRIGMTTRSPSSSVCLSFNKTCVCP